MLDGLHFESLTPRDNFGGFMDFAGGSHVVNNVDINFCTINVADTMGIVRTSVINTKVRVTGVKEANNTVTSPNWRMFVLPGTETGVECYAELVQETALTSEGFSSSYPSNIRRYGEKNNVINIGGNSIVSATGVPSSGTWSVGDKAMNSAPSAGEPIGWVCTTAGSPGTWSALGALEGLASFGDANVTLTAGTTAPLSFFGVTLTANRTITLASGFNGAKFRVTRIAAGAFTLDVGGLKSLATDEWCDVQHDGSSWVLTAYGTL